MALSLAAGLLPMRSSLNDSLHASAATSRPSPIDLITSGDEVSIYPQAVASCGFACAIW